MVLEAHDDIAIVGEADDGVSALEIARSTSIDVVVMDLHMPGMNGLVASERITTDATVLELGPAPRIVLATALDLDDHVADAARAGVFAVIHKDLRPESLLETVRTAALAVDGRNG